MKYSSSNQPIQCLMTNSTCYKGTYRQTPVGVLWHCTGANNPNVSRYVQPSDNDPNRANILRVIGKNQYGNDWNHVYVEAGVNAFIGKLADGSVETVQVMPWDYRAWGVASGYRGSCNNGWIQFEICEDNLLNPTYFNACYKEACELTAYLCRMYGINPNGNVSVNGANIPTVLCHYDSYKYGMGSGHYDIYNWFDKYGKDMTDVRRDVTALMNNIPMESTIGNVHRVLKKGATGEDVAELQKKLEALGYNTGPIDGSFGSITEAAVIQYQKDKQLVVDGVVGNQTWTSVDAEYEKPNKQNSESDTPPALNPNIKAYDFKPGDVVTVAASATTYYSGKKIAGWVRAKNWVVKSVNGDRVVIDRSTDGKSAINSPFYAKDLVLASQSSGLTGDENNQADDADEAFSPYIVHVTVDALNIRAGSSTNHDVIGVIVDKGYYTIIREENGFGKLKAGTGWISLRYTEKYKTVK